MASHPPRVARAPTVVYRPTRGLRGLGLRELLRAREVVWFLAWRDIKVRYRQTLLGVTWAVIQPVTAMLLFSLIFGRLAGLPSDGLPYPLFAYAALLPWQLFSHCLVHSSQSVVANQSLVTRVYFPRAAIPVASVLGGLVDFAIALLVFLPLLGWWGRLPGPELLYLLPVCLAVAVAAALGAGLWLSALMVRWRDVRYALPFLTQLWMFATPILYPTSLVPSAWRWLFALNPLVGVVEGFRAALLGGTGLTLDVLSASCATSLALLLSGAVFFRATERDIADLI